MTQQLAMSNSSDVSHSRGGLMQSDGRGLRKTGDQFGAKLQIVPRAARVLGSRPLLLRVEAEDGRNGRDHHFGPAEGQQFGRARLFPNG